MLTPIFLVLFIFLIISSSSHLLHHDILFHTDVARDFLILEEMVRTKSPTLIGPRAGGIPGVFHGPAWYYINLLPFVITAGNPIGMGWWWLFLAVALCVTFWGVCLKVTRSHFASLIGAGYFGLYLLPKAVAPLNNFLADGLSFLVLYSWYRWWQEPSMVRALVSWLLLGSLIQFEMAFALPLGLVVGGMFIYKISRLSLWRQILSPIILILPLASFLLFELRHNWLQSQAVIKFMTSPQDTNVMIVDFLSTRLESFMLSLDVFGLHSIFGSILLLVLLGLIHRSKTVAFKPLLMLTGSWIFGWWLATLFYPGELWEYYYSPFVGLIIFTLSVLSSRNRLALMLLVLLFPYAIMRNSSNFTYSPERFDSSSWKLLQDITQRSFIDNSQSIGYFVYSQDLYAYPLKYAFLYYLQQNPKINAAPFVKKPTTLVVAAPDDPRNTVITRDYWLTNQVHITNEPDEVINFPQGYQLRRYSLTPAQQAVPIDPNIITNLHFR